MYILNNEDFDISKILESGQIFSYEKENDTYILNINDTRILIQQIDSKTIFKNIDEDFFNKHLYNFFDMNVDYSKIREKIDENFPELKKYIEFGKGLRFLNQDFLETSTSFIISQNNNIPKIKTSINRLINEYGNGKFLSLEELKKMNISDFRNIGVGFRDIYLYNFFQNLTNEKIDELKNMDTKELFDFLVSFKGIGPKVANCIILFSMGKRDVFPIDTHIKKEMEKLYFNNEDTKIKDIETFALEKFGEVSSYIQQYIFYYCIKNKD